MTKPLDLEALRALAEVVELDSDVFDLPTILELIRLAEMGQIMELLSGGDDDE